MTSANFSRFESYPHAKFHTTNPPSHHLVYISDTNLSLLVLQKASPRAPRSKLDHCLQSLYGADRLFQQLGYQFSSLTCQGYHSTFLVREGAVDTETAMLVARDCLLASVECKILTTAMQVLSINGVSATWEELISFRRERVGTPQQIALHFAIETGLPLTAPWPETSMGNWKNSPHHWLTGEFTGK